jgi:hypothetical protein
LRNRPTLNIQNSRTSMFTISPIRVSLILVPSQNDGDYNETPIGQDNGSQV